MYGYASRERRLEEIRKLGWAEPVCITKWQFPSVRALAKATLMLDWPGFRPTDLEALCGPHINETTLARAVCASLRLALTDSKMDRVATESRRKIDHFSRICSDEHMRANRLQNALKDLSEAIQEAQAALKEMRAEPDPLAVHIFLSRRQYRNMPDTKSGKRHETAARMSWQTACELGFRGNLGEWERLMGGALKR